MWGTEIWAGGPLKPGFGLGGDVHQKRLPLAEVAGGRPAQAWFWLEWGSSELDRETWKQTERSQ
jgi:hypothetical protein